MSYVAKLDENNAVIEIRTGSLSDIVESDRSNWRSVVQTNPVFDSFSQIKTTYYFEVSQDGSIVTMKWNIENIDPIILKSRLKDYAATVRWNKQIGGVSLPNGTKILTDESSQSKIHQVYSILKEGWVQNINFKTSSGWVTINLSDANAIAQLVFSHIQNCFNNEKSITEAIDSGTLTTKAQIDNWEW